MPSRRPLLKSKRDKFNACQNNLIKQIIGLSKTCHMTKLLKLPKIINFDELYISTKLCFLESIKNNHIPLAIFDYINVNKSKVMRYLKSFVLDIKVLESYFNHGISAIFENPLNLKTNQLYQMEL